MPKLTSREVQAAFRQLANAQDAAFLQRFFKTAPGEYGAGDRFLGIRVPVTRQFARKHRDLPIPETLKLLKSKWHEERLLALFLLVDQYRRGDEPARQRAFDAYLAHTRYVNNWDLVDSSAALIVGPHLNREGTDGALLDELAASDDLWERRIAIIATQHFIRSNRFDPTLRIAEALIADSHDLIHKAAGWMLREVGKRHMPTLRAFLDQHCQRMPRTMLRYAIEHMPPRRRKRYMDGKV